MKWQTIIGVLLCSIIGWVSFLNIYDNEAPAGSNPWKIPLGLDLRSGSHITLRLLETKNPVTGEIIPLNAQTQERAIQVFQKRLNPDGTKEVSVVPEGNDRLIVELPGVTDLEQAEALVKKAGRLEFKEEVFDPSTGQTVWKTVLDGSIIKSAKPFSTPQGQWDIIFFTTTEGASIFAQTTQRLTNRRLGIFFDGAMLSAPVVQGVISDQGNITGQRSQQEAVELANFLNAGALPVDTEVIESYTVSPTLGEEAIKSSLQAGLMGLIVVVIYMLMRYRMLGVVASIALIIYAAITLACMNIPRLEVVLTLPGIAGFILSIGMAVDANVLIFERIHEEMRKGKNLSYSVEIGFSKAFSSIIDGHVTTFIGAAVLYIFGAVTVKGFGFTLALGTFWSVITATFVTRVFLNLFTDVFNIRSPKAYIGGSEELA